MKRAIILLSIICLFAGSLFAQPSIREQDEKGLNVNESMQITHALDSIIYEKYDTITSQWITYRKCKYTYDANGYKIQMLEYNLQGSSGYWFITKNDYSNDPYGIILERIECHWDTISGSWVNDTKWMYVYGTDGYEDTMKVLNWNKTDEIWYNAYNSVYDVRNENGEITEWSSYRWDNALSQWKYHYKYQYSYNSFGVMSSSCTYKGNETSTEWVNYTKSEYKQQDGNGNYLECNAYNWDTGSDQWLVNINYSITYDLDGNELTRIGKTYNEEKSQWVESTKYDYSYDDEGNEIEWMTSKWKETSSQWIGSTKKTSCYS